jgi:predicted secreted protein
MIPQFSMAKLPMSEESLGKIEGILDFCAQADPQGASKYEERKKQIADDASEKEVADARKTQEYKDGYQGISDELAKVTKDKAVEACSAYLEGK